MTAGDIVLAALAQSDEQTKIRPVRLLCQLPPFSDCLACGVTTQVRHVIPAFDETVGPDDEDYAGGGLHDRSLVRLGFLGTLTRTQIGGTLGRISSDRLGRLRQNLARHLQSALQR